MNIKPGEDDTTDTDVTPPSPPCSAASFMRPPPPPPEIPDVFGSHPCTAGTPSRPPRKARLLVFSSFPQSRRVCCCCSAQHDVLCGRNPSLSVISRLPLFPVPSTKHWFWWDSVFRPCTFHTAPATRRQQGSRGPCVPIAVVRLYIVLLWCVWTRPLPRCWGLFYCRCFFIWSASKTNHNSFWILNETNFKII